MYCALLSGTMDVPGPSNSMSSEQERMGGYLLCGGKEVCAVPLGGTGASYV